VKLKTLTAALMSFMLIGCGTQSHIISNKDQTFNRPIERIYVISDVGLEFTPEFGKAFGSKLKTILKDCRIEIELRTRSRLALDADNTYRAEMKEFNADSVLMVYHAGGVGSAAFISAMTYDVRFVDLSANRMVYRSLATFQREGVLWKSMEQQGFTFAIDLTNKMKEDRLITGCQAIVETLKNK